MTPESRVTIHMAASLDGFIARKDGRVDWLETSDHFTGGETLDPGAVEAFLGTIDCYVMGSRTYETAHRFDAEGLGWPYGNKLTVVLTSRDLPRTRDTVEFYSGDLAQLVNGRLRPAFRSIWFVGGGMVAAECLRLGLADEVRYSILPILIGDGIRFFERLDGDVALHLAEVKAYQSGMVELRYEVQGHRAEPRTRMPSDVSAVRRVGEGYLAAIRSGDVDAMMVHWADAPTLLPPNAPGVRGRDQVRAWAEAFQNRVRVIEAEFTESEVTIGGDLATERLAFTMTLEPVAGGAPIILTGKGVHLYRRQADGNWKLSLDIWNADSASAPGVPA